MNLIHDGSSSQLFEPGRIKDGRYEPSSFFSPTRNRIAVTYGDQNFARFSVISISSNNGTYAFSTSPESPSFDPMGAYNSSGSYVSSFYNLHLNWTGPANTGAVKYFTQPGQQNQRPPENYAAGLAGKTYLVRTRGTTYDTIGRPLAKPEPGTVFFHGKSYVGDDTYSREYLKQPPKELSRDTPVSYIAK